MATLPPQPPEGEDDLARCGVRVCPTLHPDPVFTATQAPCFLSGQVEWTAVGPSLPWEAGSWENLQMQPLWRVGPGHDCLSLELQAPELQMTYDLQQRERKDPVTIHKVKNSERNHHATAL